MLFIDGIIFTLQRSGGISVYFDELISYLNKNDHSFVLNVYDNHSDNNNLKVNINKAIGSLKLESSRYFERYLDVNIPDNTTVFHSSYYRLPRKNQRANIKIITTVHDFTYEKYGSGFSKLIHCYQKKRAILNSDEIVCISNNTKKDLLKFIPESRNKKISVIHNGVSEHFKHDSFLSYNSDVIFIGARNGYKNFNSAVKALISTKLNLIIIGGGILSSEEKSFLERSLPGRFMYMGFLSDEDLVKVYNSSFCLLYPSLYEGFGIPVIEAMSCGCPVIASNSSSIPEICEEAAILCNKSSSEDIFKALESLLDERYRAKLIKRGLFRAKKFSWIKTFKKTMEIYLG